MLRTFCDVFHFSHNLSVGMPQPLVPDVPDVNSNPCGKHADLSFSRIIGTRAIMHVDEQTKTL